MGEWENGRMGEWWAKECDERPLIISRMLGDEPGCRRRRWRQAAHKSRFRFHFHFSLGHRKVRDEIWNQVPETLSI